MFVSRLTMAPVQKLARKPVCIFIGNFEGSKGKLGTSGPDAVADARSKRPPISRR